MKEIKAEGTQFIYITSEFAGAGLGAAKQSCPDLDLGQASKILRATDVRLALFRSLLPPNQWVPYYLVWGDGNAAGEIDAKVQLGTDRDQDFSSAIRTHFQVTRCFSCGEQFETLVVDPGDPYPGAPDLLQEKLSRFKIKRCPKCGASLRQLVAKFL